jgi:hypothetical protein
MEALAVPSDGLSPPMREIVEGRFPQTSLICFSFVRSKHDSSGITMPWQRDVHPNGDEAQYQIALRTSPDKT